MYRDEQKVNFKTYNKWLVFWLWSTPDGLRTPQVSKRLNNHHQKYALLQRKTHTHTEYRYPALHEIHLLIYEYLNKNDEIEDHGEVVDGDQAHGAGSTVIGSVGEERPQLQASCLIHCKHCINCGKRGGEARARARGGREGGRDSRQGWSGKWD